MGGGSADDEAGATAQGGASRLRLALRASGAGLGEIDLVTGAMNTDQRVRDVFDLGARTELTAADVLARLTPTDAERMRRRMAEVRTGDEPDVFSGEVATQDGTPRYFDLVVEIAERDEAGPRRMVGLVREVTAWVSRIREAEAERKRAEALVEQLNHRVRNNVALGEALAKSRVLVAAARQLGGTLRVETQRSERSGGPEQVALTLPLGEAAGPEGSS